jgi:hypothetical protein
LLQVVRDDEEEETVAKQSLADASEDALDGMPEPTTETEGQPGEQTALVPACKIKFQGVSYDSLKDVPDLKAEVSFIVTGRVVGHEDKVFKDGDVRTIVKVDASKVVPYEA